ncbi:hypothetical protein COU80_05960 [Candidatus Peregrinibacteria bacterium CG10_big_fil_rev_8_21_14_0_10_55_24]|nr:MAG: hypothetical protein COU80_05960 [Candidatus Peregrinibacteria bacterium CG10_big_fil_rev_8_21_14_0_10_55_24]
METPDVWGNGDHCGGSIDTPRKGVRIYGPAAEALIALDREHEEEFGNVEFIDGEDGTLGDEDEVLAELGLDDNGSKVRHALEELGFVAAAQEE